jgi:membrane-bound lytic murein transglycosylase D
MQPIHRLVTAAFVAALTACAVPPPRSAAPPAATVDDANLNALYARLDQDSKRYENGLVLAREGKNDQAQAEIAAALDGLRAAATSCAAVSGCEQQRFVAAFDRLLRMSTGSLAGQAAEGETNGATPEAADEAGASSPVVAAVPELGRSLTLV